MKSESLKALIEIGFTPVFAPLTHDEHGHLLNTNADTMASSLAVALSRFYDVRLIYCFEKKGVFENVDDENSVINFINKEKYKQLLNEQKLFAGILPKIDNAFAAIDAGVHEVLIGDANDLIQNTTNKITGTLIEQSEKYKNDLLPGYTHLQLAMPSSFGLWFGAYAESLVDDLITLQAAYQIVNKNPLGSAAGYGSSFLINRTLTTELLGFDDLHYNVVNAQMSRGKTERIVAAALSNIADTLAKLSMDVCLYMNQNFGFISFPDELTTGSSIMPHKKNPDVFELIRSHCNQVKALPNEIMMMTTNLPSGYHRDLQLLKEHLFTAFTTLKDCINIAALMLSNIEIKKDILSNEKYKYLFSVEEVNKLVNQGMPFRDAYKKVGLDIEANQFNYSTNIHHTHEGSIGNLMNDKIAANMKTLVENFHFEKYHKAIEKLLSQ